MAAAVTTSAGDTRARAMQTMARGTNDIVARIDELKALTEREVLGCGVTLSLLLDKARELVDESDRNAAASRARSEEIASRFVDGMQSDIHGQQDAVQRVLQLMDGIQDAVKAIERMTQSSHILTINIAIEAARVGEAGKGFAVIASQMRQLGGTIEHAAESVTSAINGVRAGLPPVLAHATSMNTRTQSFIGDIAEEVRQTSLQAKSASQLGRLDSVVELSNVALSHLQFQDPLAQRLTAITEDLGRLTTRVGAMLEGSTEVRTEEQDSSSLPASATTGLVLF